jgi:hypothetical protein
MTCLGYKYELNKRFKQKGSLSICNNGFHFCEKVNHCFNHYDFKRENRVFEIKAFGEIETNGDKSCCLEIELVRELSWQEVLKLANTGMDNTGHSNIGDRNSGDSNSGDSNSGNRNSGNSNSGYSNSGNWNSGDRNSGYSNSGYSNSGNWNSGDRNSGDRNSGDSNSGAFCLDSNPALFLFDKPTEIKVRDWENHKAVQIMNEFLNQTIWVPQNIMTDEEKKSHPKYETTEGYLKTITLKEAWRNMWPNLSEANKKVFTTLPNFDWQKFTEITGIEKEN